MVEGRTHKPVILKERCQQCNICVRGCPAEIIPEFRQEDNSLRGTLYGGKVSGLPPKASDPLPPCQDACPVHQDTRGYAALVAQGKFSEALELIRRTNPLPAICGFVCHHPCEEACLREDVDQPVPLRLLKRFVAEQETAEGPVTAKPRRHRKAKVLVVGSGPAGLAAAHDLSLLGYRITIWEVLPVLGGMLTVGIPEFRLPRGVLHHEIERIQSLGVEIETGHRFSLDSGEKALSKLGYDAAFIATGAHRSVKLNLPGEDRNGTLYGVEFLRGVNLGEKVEIGKRVAVIGGGNVALDAARTALRLGSRVEVYYRRSRGEMPAIAEEVDEAIREGIKLHLLTAPARILGKGDRVAGLECVRMKLGEPDDTGRRRPAPVPGSSFRVSADTLIAAIGQRTDPRALKGLELNENGTVRVDPRTGATSSKGIFAGGDVVTGPGWAIDAIQAGKKAAESIHRYLS
jgi:NADPH-dependent glutamate synthase beta subunit-like oxidoreductase